MTTIVCQGCGAEIQTKDPKEIGYVPASALDKDTVICKRCFRLKHYNEIQDIDFDDNDFLNMLHEIGQRNALFVYIIDIFDVQGSLIQGLNRFVGNNPVILVGNKVDLLPKSTSLDRVKRWMRTLAKEASLNVSAVHLVSAKQGTGINEATADFEAIRKGRDIYVVGATNVGKSSLINYLISDSAGEENVITTSYFPGTTLGLIEIALDDDSSLYDTPGIMHHGQLAHYLSDKDLKLVTPKKEIKPKVYQLNSGQTLFFGGLARLDIVTSTEKLGYVCYLSNEVHIHRTKTEKADELYENHLGGQLAPPSLESIDTWPSLKIYDFSIQGGDKDIVFPGLGWVRLPNEKVSVRAHVPEGMKAVIREAII